jgi:hypothetical protein
MVDSLVPHRLLTGSRFIVRDFVYSEDELTKQREDLSMADTTEKELWVCGFSFVEFQLLNHIQRPSSSAYHEPISQNRSKSSFI